VNPKHVKELLHATPFVPFSLVLANVFGPTTFINPLLIVEVVRETETTGS
jgi:hypothetical protein